MSAGGKLLLLLLAAVIAGLWVLHERIKAKERDRADGIGLTPQEERTRAARVAEIEMARRRRQRLVEEEIARREERLR